MLPRAELRLLVKQKRSRSVSGLHCERGQRLMLLVELNHAPEINVADYIDVM